MEAGSICKGSSTSSKHSALAPFIFLLSISAYCNDSLQAMEESNCLENERSALLAIKSDMYDPGDWFSSWIDRDCCKWRGVRCDNITGHVTELDLHNPYPYYVYEEDPFLYMLDSFSPGRIGVSKLNPSMQELKHLKYLDLSMNNFSYAHIPSMIASLEHLEYLNLSRTLFCGLVPPQLGNLSSLHYLDLNGCDSSLYYTFKSCLCSGGFQWLSHIPSLEYLDMSCVDISRATNWLQEINSLGTFRVLNLGNAKVPPVTSPLPRFNLTSISQISLFHYRNFSNAMLSWLSNASNLQYLDLRECYSELHVEQLQVSLGALPNLKKLEVANNLIEGEISGILINISTSLQHLDVSYNDVSGEIADILLNLRHLEYLSLDSTHVRGYLPHIMGNLTTIRHLSVSNTHSRTYSRNSGETR